MIEEGFHCKATAAFRHKGIQSGDITAAAYPDETWGLWRMGDWLVVAKASHLALRTTGIYWNGMNVDFETTETPAENSCKFSYVGE